MCTRSDILIILPISGVEHTGRQAQYAQHSVAKKYGGGWRTKIAQYNGLDTQVALEIGSTIIIPDGAIARRRAHAPWVIRPLIRGPYLGGGGTVLTGY